MAGFGLAFAAGLISGGRLGGIYGRRRIFTLGLALLTLASTAGGLAPTAWFLITARVLQGGAAALMTPQVLAILGTVYTGERRAKAFAAYGMTMDIAGVLGQLIGGSLIALDIAGLDLAIPRRGGGAAGSVRGAPAGSRSGRPDAADNSNGPSPLFAGRDSRARAGGRRPARHDPSP